MVDVTLLTKETGILLDPEDWFRATWRDLDPLPRPVYPKIDMQEWAEYTPEQYLRAGLDSDLPHMAENFARHVLPYLSREERRALSHIVREAVSRVLFPVGYGERLPPIYLFAAYLGVHEPLETLVTGWQDFQFGKYVYRSNMPHPHRPWDVVMGLGDPEKIIFHMRRLALPIRTPESIRAWLANTGLTALDMIHRCILTERSNRKAAAMIETLGLVRNPQVAPLMLETMLNSRGGNAARTWLDSYPELSIPGLIPVAEGRNKIAEGARDYLRGLARRGQTDFLERYVEPKLLAKLLDKSVQRANLPRLDKTTTPDWLHQSVREIHRLSKADTTRTIDLDRLPPMVVGEMALNPEQVQAVLLAIWLDYQENPKAQVTVRSFAEALRANIGQAMLDDFTWALVSGWLNAGAPARERWFLNGLSLLGSDQLMSRFHPLILDWAKRNLKLFRIGLECLAYVGTDTALMELFRLEQTLTTKQHRRFIRNQIETVAQALKLTEDQLLDRAVPDCGLDSDGSHTFDYGPRQFQLILHHDLTPTFRDQAGKVRSDLPRPTAQDDIEKAEIAQKEWQHIRQQLRTVPKSQTARLERQMVNEWQWTWPEFDRYFLQHPLMRYMAQMIVWGCYQPDFKQSFRITQEGTFTDAYDQAVEPDRDARIGIVHPLHLGESERSAWGQLLHDYDIIPPFSQIGREIFLPTPEELTSNQIRRFEGLSMHVLGFNGTLLKLGWHNNHRVQREFPGFDVTAILTYEQYGQKDGHMALGSLRFYPGNNVSVYRREMNQLPLAQVPPLVFSEVIRDLSLVFKR